MVVELEIAYCCSVFFSLLQEEPGSWKSLTGCRLPGGRGIVVAALLAMPLVQLAIPSIGVAVYKDAAKLSDGTVTGRDDRRRTSPRSI